MSHRFFPVDDAHSQIGSRRPNHAGSSARARVVLHPQQKSAHPPTHAWPTVQTPFRWPLRRVAPVQRHDGPDFSESLPTILRPCRTQPILLQPVIRLNQKVLVGHFHYVDLFSPMDQDPNMASSSSTHRWPVRTIQTQPQLMLGESGITRFMQLSAFPVGLLCYFLL